MGTSAMLFVPLARIRPSFGMALFTAAASSLLFGMAASAAAQSLAVSYGNKGVQTISFAGLTLENTVANPADAFHIWHMKSTDLRGNVILGWGESNNGESWNAAACTETYTYAWGSISTRFTKRGNNLDMVVTETNNPGSGIIFDGAEIYPFALHFPQDPAGFSGYNQWAVTTTGPGVSVADFGAGVVTSVIPDESKPLYGGWKSAGNSTYSPLMTTTTPDGFPNFLPHNDYPVQPGSSFSYTVSLRFTPEGTPANATDAYSSFATTYPSQMTWSDHRIIGSAYVASSPPPSGTPPGTFVNNPRRYFNDPSVNVNTPAGLQSFQNRVLSLATADVTNAKAMNAQGVITWDIEGEQFPQSTTYVCSPDQIAAVAPEMESTITNPSSGYLGQRLDDAYFKTISSAGLKVGLCLRPQVFTLGGNGTASQVYLNNNAAIIANLENKAKAANSRWGATIFYVDSTVDISGGTLDPAIFQQLITDFPSFLFIPEESTPRYYAYTAPFYSFIFHTSLGTDASIYNVYPKAFGANLINDVSAATLATYTPQLIQAVSRGDILMGHVEYWQANNPTLVSIYQAAGAGSGPPPPQVPPSITWSPPAPITYGTPLSSLQLDASANTAGTFVYTPTAGTVLTAGRATLMTTFTPLDTVDYQSATASAQLTVTQATPVVTWTPPAPLTAGTPLGPAQLNASANIPGSFTYNPGPGVILPAGANTLQATFAPSDSLDYTSASASVVLQVNQAGKQTPNIFWPNPAAITYGTILGGAQLNAVASAPGTFSYNPGPGAVLHAGGNTLQATFNPFDTSTYTSATSSVPLFVAQAVPVINWPAPAPILSGNPLGPAQLNATASVPGQFNYNPGPGSVLNPGVQSLNATFVPADTTDYTYASASVPLTVNAPAAPTSRLSILYPSSGTPVSGRILIVAQCTLQLDAAGTHLIVDGLDVPGSRVPDGPFIYPFDTTTLTNGSHTLQLWGHDTGNNTTLSALVTIVVAN